MDSIDSLKNAVERRSDDTTKVRLLNNLSNALRRVDPVQAEIHAFHALNLAEKLSDSMQIAKAHTLLGLLDLEFNTYDRALQHFYSAMDIYKSRNDTFSIAKVTHNLGVFYYAQGMYDTALDYYYQALDRWKEADKKEHISKTYNNLGATYHEMNDLASALNYYQQSMQIKKKLDDEISYAITLANTGSVYNALQEPANALAILQEAIEIFERIQDNSNLSLTYRILGEVYTQSKDYDSAFYYFDKAKSASEYIQSGKMLFMVWLGYAELYGAMNDPVKELEHFKKYAALKDSIFNYENVQKMLLVKSRYDERQIEQESKAQSQRIELLEKQNAINRLIGSILIGSIIVIAALSWLFYKNQQLKSKKSHELFQAQEELNKVKVENLNQQLGFKNRELASMALQFVQQNDFLDQLREQLNDYQVQEHKNGKHLDKVLKSIDQSKQLENSWKEFKLIFEQVHHGFFTKIRDLSHEISPSELKLCALLKLNMSSKEISAILGISPESVKTSRSRLRKKLHLPRETNLVDFMMNV